MVQARAIAGVADIHAWAFAHRLQAFQNLDRTRAVIGVVVIGDFWGFGAVAHGWLYWLMYYKNKSCSGSFYADILQFNT